MQERSHGRAHAALGVVNAIGTGGLGAAAALSLWTRVEAWRCSGYSGRSLTRGRIIEVDPVILRSVDEAVASAAGVEPLGGLCAEAWSEIPLEAGLKGSSALVNALVEAAAGLHGLEFDEWWVARVGVEAARRAGLTVTGALDDHLSTLLCGLHATDNRRQERVLHVPRVEGYAAIAVPGRRSIRGIDPSVFAGWRGLYLSAWGALLRGDWPAAATLNGVATLLATGDERGLEAVNAALAAGALAAGVSGKGPAVYAVAGERGEAERLARLLGDTVGGEALVAELLGC